MQSFGLATVGRDVEVRFPQGSNDAVAELSLAFPWGKKGQDGRRQTCWVAATIWGKRAEALAQYLTKGTKVAVTLADVHMEEFTDREGNKRTKLVGRVEQIELAGSPPQRDQAAPPPAPAPRQQAQRPAPRPSPAPAPSGYDDMDDDIPYASPYMEHDPINGHRKAQRARAAR